MIKKYLIIAIIILLVGCQSQDTLKIGAIYPLTGPGIVYGIPIQKATNLAVEEINAQGGIGGKKLEVIYEDGKCNGKDSATAANKLINYDKVKIILGGICSGETLGAGSIAEESNVILFSPGSTSPLITNAGDNIFRNMASDATSAVKIAERIGNKKAALLTENTEYPQSMANVFKENFKGELVADEKYESFSSDFRTQITKIKQTNAEAIYIVPQGPGSLGIILQQIKELDLKVDLYSNVYLGSKDVLDNYALYAEGGLFSEPFFDPTTEKAQEFIEKYENEYDETVGQGIAPLWYATAYDAPFIFKEIIEKVGLDSEKIKQELYNLENREGTAGSLTMDENGDPFSSYVFQVIQNGKPVVLEE